MKRYITGLFTFLLPSFLLRLILRILGHKIGYNVKIGFSFLCLKEISLANNVKIGHFNIFLNNSFLLEKNSKIGYLNFFKGPFNLILKNDSEISNKNYLTRAKKGVSYGESNLTLHQFSIITVSHHLDLTRSITFGEYSILAGIRSQMWTHGYYHADKGLDRIRIDGEITIGNNVYIGSSCIFNPGVKVGNAIHIGGGSVISKNIDEKGMYVNQPLRFIENDINIIKSKLIKVEGFNLVETFYTKK